MILRSSLLRLLVWCCLFTTSSFAQTLAEEKLGGEKASFTIKQMSTGVSYRQDVCERYRSMQSGTMNVKDALRGMKLNVVLGAYDGSYFNYDDETGIDPVYPGIVGVIMDELALRAGFTWRDSFGIYDTPAGAEFNETWTDLLGWSVETYDITADWWGRSLDRMNMGVAFLREWYDSSIIMIGQEQRETADNGKIEFDDFWNWLKPFDTEVWMTTLATVVASGLVYQLLEWVAGEHDERTFWEWFADNIFLSFLNATQAYEYGTPRSIPSKIFSFSMALWALILTATYTANLASLLVDRVPSILEIETVEEAAVFGYPLCTWGGTITDLHIEQNYPKAVRKEKKTIEEVYEGLNAGECAFAVETVQGWLEFRNKRQYNPSCNLEWTGDGRTVSSNGASFVTKADAGYKCTGLIRDVINFYMEELISEGFLADAWDFENARKQDIDCDTFRSELLNELNDGNDERRLRQMMRVGRTEVAQDIIAPSTSSYRNGNKKNRRKLKASTKAASSAGAIDGTEAEQMELEAMIGSFFIHWVLMGLSIVIAVGDRLWKDRKARMAIMTKIKDLGETAELTEDAIIGDLPNGYSREEVPRPEALQRQIATLNRSLDKSHRSQTRMMEEQQELRGQIEALSGILQSLVKEEIKKEVHISGTF